MLFVHNTSHVADEPYPELLREKGFGMFPSLAFMSADGTKLASPLAREVESFEVTLQALGSWASLADKAERSAAEEASLFVAMLDLGRLDLATARDGAGKHLGELQGDRAAHVENEIRLLEVKDVLSRAGRDRSKAFAELAQMAKVGRIPTGSRAMTFWIGVLTHAKDSKDAELLEKSIDAVDKEFGKRPGTEAILSRFRAGLAELKKG